MSQAALKPVLLSKAQMVAILQIQEQERANSKLGVAPSIHVIARQLMDNALATMRGELVGGGSF